MIMLRNVAIFNIIFYSILLVWFVSTRHDKIIKFFNCLL